MNKEGTIIGVTGHRSLSHDYDVIKKAFREKLYQLDAGAVVSGMAVGFDMLAAEMAIEEDIPFVAAIPFRGHTKPWPTKEKNRFIELMRSAWKCHVVSKGGYAAWKLHARNKFIVDRSHVLISYWSGGQGGTKSTVDLAEKAGLPHENLYSHCHKITTQHEDQ